jgi:hypothetical protein
MQGRLIPRWSAARFSQRVTATRFALVAVGRGRVQMDHGMVAWFDHTFPRQFSVGTLDTTKLPAGFAESTFRTSRGAMRMGPSGPQAGTYLFDRGTVIGFHTGVVGFAPVRDDVADFVRTKVRIGDPDTVVAITRYLSEIASRKLRGESEWRTESPPPRQEAPPPRQEAPPPRDRRRPPPQRPTTPPPNADYELLGITVGATLKQVSVAYRDQVKLNPPDKVAHLSPALQKFAEQQTVALTLAYQRIKSGLR